VDVVDSDVAVVVTVAVVGVVVPAVVVARTRRRSGSLSPNSVVS
jgi:hypothetical protein